MNVGRASVSDHVKVPKVYSITFPAKRVGGKGIKDCVRTQVECFPRCRLDHLSLLFSPK